MAIRRAVVTLRSSNRVSTYNIALFLKHLVVLDLEGDQGFLTDFDGAEIAHGLVRNYPC